MRKRIEELATQAGANYRCKTRLGQLQEFDEVKFANLIIQDCIAEITNFKIIYKNGTVVENVVDALMRVKCEIEEKLCDPKLKIRVSPKILERNLTEREAVAYCEALGNGARLPTVEELKLIHEKTDHDFEKSWYITSSKSNDNGTLFYNFLWGTVNTSWTYDDEKNHVRVVYDLQE